ncbi:hypothetical protein Q4485_10875 [Granulosicoccaceae sp. 1_MG-2023]|nr:hypothetical protein [Granulosicoccaceae sp. 1_MG-2023]
MRKARSVISALALAGMLGACAQSGGTATTDSKSGGERPSGPPPEAFTACEGKSAGDAVSFSGRGGETMEAVCAEHDGQLVAVPEGGAGPRRP